KYTSTGNFPPGLRVGAHTLRYRQSSLMPAERNTMSPYNGRCMQRGPKWSALRTPVQPLTGCGGFQRREPTGGAAYGMPLNSSRPDLASRLPDNVPVSMRTVGTESAANTASTTSAKARPSKRTNPRRMNAVDMVVDLAATTRVFILRTCLDDCACGVQVRAQPIVLPRPRLQSHYVAGVAHHAGTAVH